MAREWRILLGCDVLAAARERLRVMFADTPRVYLSFSAGKDSTVLLHLTAEAARAVGRTFGILFVDWEAQFQLTITHAEAMLARYQDVVDAVHWVCLPLRTTNATSMIEPEWACWAPEKRDLWVRDPPARAITDPAAYPFYQEAMTFEEFMPAFGQWYAGGRLTACLVGTRAAESLNRWWAMVRDDKATFRGRQWTTWMGGHVYNVYPLYDWATEDIWTYHAQTGQPYNPLYDRMHQAGLTLSQMRICEPYGDEQRKGLWLYQVIEPDTWGRVVARVAGANTGALYAGERGNVMGNATITLPAGHTWESFARLLLDSLPPPTAEHYRNKIAVWMQWYRTHGSAIADSLPGDTGSDDMPSWRRVCKMLLKNDYWCKMLNFSPTKTAAYDRYTKLMRKRRRAWNLI